VKEPLVLPEQDCLWPCIGAVVAGSWRTILDLPSFSFVVPVAFLHYFLVTCDGERLQFFGFTRGPNWYQTSEMRLYDMVFRLTVLFESRKTTLFLNAHPCHAHEWEKCKYGRDSTYHQCKVRLFGWIRLPPVTWRSLGNLWQVNNHSYSKPPNRYNTLIHRETETRIHLSSWTSHAS